MTTVRQNLMLRLRTGLLHAGALLLLTSPLHAQRDLKDIPPPDPELERQSFELPRDSASISTPPIRGSPNRFK